MRLLFALLLLAIAGCGQVDNTPPPPLPDWWTELQPDLSPEVEMIPTPPAPPPPPTPMKAPAEGKGIVFDVQSRALRGCRFIPHKATVLAILSVVSGNPLLATAAGAAAAICEAVTEVNTTANTLSSAGEDGTHTHSLKCAAYLEGICIEGSFVEGHDALPPDED